MSNNLQLMILLLPIWCEFSCKLKYFSLYSFLKEALSRQFSSLVKTPQNFNEKTFFIPWNCSYRKPRKKYYGISPRKNLLWSVLSDISQIKNTQDSSNPFLFSPSAKSEPLFWRIYIHSIMFSATHSFPPPPQKKQNKTKKSWNRWHCSLKLGSYFVKSHYATLILLHIISLICAQRFSASSFYRTNLVEVANVWRMTQILPVKSETGQEIRRRTGDILPVQEHQRFIGAYIEVSRLRDPPGH